MSASRVLTRRCVNQVLLAMLAGACAAPPARPSAPAPKPVPPLHHGPLTDYVPSAGLRWMLVGAPRKLAESPAFRSSLALLLPQTRLEAFAAGAGVDARKIESCVIAGFDLGTLYLYAPPPGSVPNLTRRFRERVVNGERVDTPHPDIRRVTGIVGDHPQMLVTLSDRAVAVAVGDPTLGRIAEAFARKKLHNSPSALRGAALSQLDRPPADAIATFYAPGPFLGEWAQGARGLLANAVALSISVAGRDPERAALHLELNGDFPASGADDLREGFRDLARSSTGKLLGLDQLPEPTVREREGRLLLEIELDLPPIARGLRAAVIADVWEIFDMQPRPDSTLR